ncbi:MAG: hypothetical protein Q4Q06_02400 [Bacteroidota bacterium]|nr:hypothetical protein [Bacteroidota bacterium]
MEKKKLLALLLCLPILVLAQRKPTYQPMTTEETKEIEQTLYNRNISDFIITQAIPIGPISLTNVLNTISHNPIEGTRIRLSLETNNKFSKRLGLSGMVAYGTKDKEWKYSIGAAYNFAKKAKGVYAFPSSTLAIHYGYNTFIPSYSNYDVAYFSLGNWDRFYFGRKETSMLSFLQDFKMGISLRPFVSYEKTDSYLLYDKGEIIQLLAPFEYLENYAGGLSLSFSPVKDKGSKLNILNSRFYYFPSNINLTYSYNYQKYKTEQYYHYVYLSAQHRFYFRPMALDVRLMAGKIFGESYHYTYFSPNYRVGDISNMFGFNLYSEREMRFKEYAQTFLQFNFGGILLDNIFFLKQFKPNEFINLKTLFIQDYPPYMEVGVGIDHIFTLLGIEVVKRISSENPMNMPEWSLKIRCTL